MSLACFIVACFMLAYDCLGHVLCGIARYCGATGRSGPAVFWNTHSKRIWPCMTPMHYDVHWSLWHGTTLALFIIAHVTA